MSVIKKISLKCDGHGCTEFLNLNRESVFDARIIAFDMGWRTRIINNRTVDLCERCLRENNFRSYKSELNKMLVKEINNENLEHTS